MQQQDNAARHHHRQRASDVNDSHAGRFTAVEAVDIERTELRLNELEKLAGQCNLAGFVLAEQQIDRCDVSRCNLLTSVGLSSSGQLECFQNGADDGSSKLVGDALYGVLG